jgi:hypothetical protein
MSFFRSTCCVLANYVFLRCCGIWLVVMFFMHGWDWGVVLVGSCAMLSTIFCKTLIGPVYWRDDVRLCVRKKPKPRAIDDDLQTCACYDWFRVACTLTERLVGWVAQLVTKVRKLPMKSPSFDCAAVYALSNAENPCAMFFSFARFLTI